MRWIDRLERRFGDWAIPQFPLFIVLANAAVYILSYLKPMFATRLYLDPAAIAQGEYWRLFTFLFVPPANITPFWLVIWLFVLYQYGQALENEWGEFKFCLFYLVGALATVVAALLIVRGPIDNIWLNGSLFLAFATLYPESELPLFFILPVKVKYLGWFAWAGIVFSFVMGDFPTRMAILASLCNYYLFFGRDIGERAKLRLDVYRNRKRFYERD
jgi:membrane associated rhomboid family serine protease